MAEHGVERRMKTLIGIPLVNYLRRILKTAWYRSKPIEKNKIVMATSRGTYNCHLRAVSDEILRRKLPIKIVWVTRSGQGGYPQEITLVKRYSFEFLHEAATAKVLIDNSVNLQYMHVKKRRKQVLIEMWHGTFALKRFDAEVNKNKAWVRKAYSQGKKTDYCLTNCEFEEKLFRNTFWSKAQMLRFGHPRNDMLFSRESVKSLQIKQKVLEYFGIEPGTNVILYAPTYRQCSTIFDYETLDYASVISSAERKFGGKWIILVRYHFLDGKISNLPQENPKVMNATLYPDIQDLMLVSNIGITDYSSWIYDYMFTQNPCFLYTPDVRDYLNKEREFLFSLQDLPFPMAQTNAQLVDNILSFDEFSYHEKYDAFCQRINAYENGNAAAKTVDFLETIML